MTLSSDGIIFVTYIILFTFNWTPYRMQKLRINNLMFEKRFNINKEYMI